MPGAEAQRKLQTAYSLHQSGRLAEAARLYRELVDADANNFHALHFLGLIEAQSGNMERAESLTARSLSIRPPNVQFIENYATALYRNANYGAAAKACRDGLDIQNNNVSLLYMSALSLYKLGKLPES